MAGEYFTKAYDSTVFAGKNWEPLRPINASRIENKIVIKYLVPVPPLVIDTTAVTNPGNFGFQFSDDSEVPPAISSVQLTGADEISIWLTSSPQGNNKKIRYAVTAPSPACPGPTNGARGNLRDSDNTPSRSNKPLYNWSVGFEITVN